MCARVRLPYVVLASLVCAVGLGVVVRVQSDSQGGGVSRMFMDGMRVHGLSDKEDWKEFLLSHTFFLQKGPRQKFTPLSLSHADTPVTPPAFSIRTHLTSYFALSTITPSSLTSTSSLLVLVTQSQSKVR